MKDVYLKRASIPSAPLDTQGGRGRGRRREGGEEEETPKEGKGGGGEKGRVNRKRFHYPLITERNLIRRLQPVRF